MRAVITGGGTGGHLFPGIALALALRERRPASEILFIGTPRLLDQQALQNRGFQPLALPGAGIKGMGRLAQLRSLLRQPVALWRARQILARFRPELVFGMGGYVTGPVLVAAKTLGVATAIHEQNAVPGLANRLVAHLVDRVCISLPCAPAFPAGKTVCTGNPVRADILEASVRKERNRKRSTTPSLLILGGSQGAHALNTRMPEVLAILRRRGLEAQVVHQSGSADADAVRRAYAQADIAAVVQPFITDMATAYEAADLVVSRAGATTLAELAVMGLPAVLIPYPFAADDHQAKNAAHYTRGGGALMFRQEEASPELLATRLHELLTGEDKLRRMGRAMHALGEPGAATRLVDECLALVAERSPTGG